MHPNSPPTPDAPFRLSPSSVRLYQSCARKFKHRYVDGIEGKIELDDALKFGLGLHAILESNIHVKPSAWSVAKGVEGLDLDQAALLAGVASAYSVHWADSLAYSAAEVELETELRNPRLTFTTILDGLAKTAVGIGVVVEHKTTTSDIRPGGFYWERTILDVQGSAYLWAARLHGHDAEHIEWDAIARPKLRRRTEAIEPQYYSRAGKWGKAGDLKPGTGIPAESPAEFAARVKATVLAEPAAYFQRVSVVRLENELVEALADIEQVGEQVLASWDRNAWPRNTSSCWAFGRRCEFLPICQGETTPADTELYQLRTTRGAK